MKDAICNVIIELATERNIDIGWIWSVKLKTAFPVLKRRKPWMNIERLF